jgi:hypothetical protein
LKSAARVLGVKPANLQSEADAGRVPFTKVGDEYLFALAALEETLLARAQGKAVARGR